MLLTYKQQNVAANFQSLEMDVNITGFAGLVWALELENESHNYEMCVCDKYNVHVSLTRDEKKLPKCKTLAWKAPSAIGP